MMILLRAQTGQRCIPYGIRPHQTCETRQMVDHKHILVNGKCVNIPSYLVKAGDVIEVKEKANLLRDTKMLLR